MNLSITLYLLQEDGVARLQDELSGLRGQLCEEKVPVDYLFCCEYYVLFENLKDKVITRPINK